MSGEPEPEPAEPEPEPAAPEPGAPEPGAPEPAAPGPFEPESAAPKRIARIVGVVLDCPDPEPLVAFWSAALGYRVDHAWGQFVTLVPPERGLPPLTLQTVPEPKVVKNRMHLDLVADGGRAKAVARLVAMGARVVAEHTEGDWRWNIVADPAGNEFCVIGRADEDA